MGKLNIKTYGDPILREKCKEVREINNDIKNFAKKIILIRRS